MVVLAIRSAALSSLYIDHSLAMSGETSWNLSDCLSCRRAAAEPWGECTVKVEEGRKAEIIVNW